MIISGISTLASTSFTADATVNGITVGKGANSVATNTVVGYEACMGSNTTGDSCVQ